VTTARTVATPIGPLLLVGDGEVLRGIYFPEHRPVPRLPPHLRTVDDGFDVVVAQLEEWFSGARTRFDIALALDGTELQQQVWRALLDIPYGETRTYGELATQLGRPNAARAIGHAVARNPVSVVVPCHRVVGRDGTLTGYAGGVDRKRALLVIEQRNCRERAVAPGGDR
jgi:methylated-DNA-[protein]-cysteine S-methyltransferase